MAKTNPLAGLGNKLSKALKAHKDEESTQEDFGSLPAGIEGGVAQVFDCKVDHYKDGKLKGKPYFSARATVVAPEYFTDMRGVKRKVKGLHTKIGPEPLCDTLDRQGDKSRKTVDQHVEWVLKMLRTLGVDTADIDDDDSLMDAIEGVKEDAPYITFRTWQGKPTKQFPDPRVNEVWLGLYDYDEEEEEDDDEVDDKTSSKKKRKTEEEDVDDDTDDDDADDEEPAPKAKKGGKKAKKVEEEDDDEDEDADEADDEDDDDEAFDDGAENLEELAEEADGGDKDAKRKLLDMAAAKGVRKVKGMTFADLVEKLSADDDTDEDDEDEKPKVKKSKGKKVEEEDDDDDEDESEDDDDTAEWEPQEDEAYGYLPDDEDPKTGKPYKKPIQVIVLKVDPKRKTVDLMDNKTKRKFTKVKWLDLQQSDD